MSPATTPWRVLVARLGQAPSEQALMLRCARAALGLPSIEAAAFYRRRPEGEAPFLEAVLSRQEEPRAALLEPDLLGCVQDVVQRGQPQSLEVEAALLGMCWLEPVGQGEQVWGALLLAAAPREALGDGVGQMAGLLAAATDQRRLHLRAGPTPAPSSLAFFERSSAHPHFMARMGHELRSPLNTILGMTEALQEQVYGPLNGDQQEALEAVGLSSRHLLNIVEELLELGHLSSDQMRHEPVAVELGSACSQAMMLVRAGLQTAASLHVNLPDEPVWLMADPKRLRQILLNLLENAVKHCAGRVELSLSVDDGHRAHICVDDDGPGVPVEERALVFEPFHQIVRDRRGVGLGLALVWRLVALHSGRIEIGESPLGGARFELSFPRLEPSHRPKFSDDWAAAPSRLRPSSQTPDLRLYSQWLQAHGVQARLIHHSALNTVEALQTDLVVWESLRRPLPDALDPGSPHDEWQILSARRPTLTLTPERSLAAPHHLQTPVSEGDFIAACKSVLGPASPWPCASACVVTDAPLIMLLGPFATHTTDFLMAQGYYPHAHAQFHTAITAAAELGPDAIILNIEDRPQLMNLIGPLRDVCPGIASIIVTTSHLHPELPQDSFQAGADDFIASPILPSLLEEVLACALI